MSKKQLSIIVSPEEFELHMQKKRKLEGKAIVNGIRDRLETLQGQLKNKKSIQDVLVENLVKKDKFTIFFGDEETLWDAGDIDLIQDTILKCDEEHSVHIEMKMEEDYHEKVFKGIPCDPALKEKIKEYGIKIAELNRQREELAEKINTDLYTSIWESANTFMSLKSRSD